MGLRGLPRFEVSKALLFVEQVSIMCQKHISQRKRNGRQFLKDSIMIQFFTLAFIVFIINQASNYTASPHFYGRIPLPPLSKSATNGVFNEDAPGNLNVNSISQRLYYAPSNHAGVNALIDALIAVYPDVKAIGAADAADMNKIYENNLFDTWATLDFQLSANQLSSGRLIPSQSQVTDVSYTISVNPTIWGNLPTSNYSSPIYNNEVAPSDLFWSSGYLTLQNFVEEYLVQQYNGQGDFSIDAYIQRFPKSPVYEKQIEVNISSARQGIWKWIGGTILSICLFVPIMPYLIEIVRERQFMMKDMLEISGLMDASYWTSYLLIIMLNGLLSIAFILGFLRMTTLLDDSRVGPYAALMTIYVFGSCCFAMFFGFLVPRSEYYGLPIFVSTVALTVCGAYMGAAENITTSVKLLLCFLSPSMGLTIGVISIENYLHYHAGDLNYYFVNTSKAYPDVSGVIGVLFASGLFYLLLILLIPIDVTYLLFERAPNPGLNNVSKTDSMKYPCDTEDDEPRDTRRSLLKVNNLAHIYPDGTCAVRDISFNVREGEVLSFLGANGAGKSTTMNMLCGTLEATIGDAWVKGRSITKEKVLARRNLGIAMQKDVIWDDVNVEDHLFFFARLRGLRGASLRQSVSDMLVSLGFPEKKHSLAGTLSGGQKRRLCVGLAMVGGSSVVYLDEPTAGLDPVSRRQLWELVQRNRAGRAILLTTHFMDEADVLGDRIAIVKEGRMRAIGTSRFLKERFGLGYMLRMSMQEQVDNRLVHRMVCEYIDDVSVASAAGTEFSLRLPRDAVPVFPRMLERLENESASLGVVSYGIETTTLEEVFMRLVNEDNELLLKDHPRANRLLAASASERDSNREELKKRDEERVPLNASQMQHLLSKGKNVHGSGMDTRSFRIQVLIILQKRFYQFFRSRGQWTMGVVMPIILVILAGALLSNTPKSLLGNANEAVLPTYYNFFPTQVTGENRATTLAAVSAAFDGRASLEYVGKNYSALYNSINDVASDGIGASIVDGIAYSNATSFTVMYNASYSVNFVGAVQALSSSAVSSATNGLLQTNGRFNSLPNNKLGNQMNSAFFSSMLIALIGGSFGAGLSIIISGERVTMVKHQQLASGTSSVAYWVGSFLWDFSLMFVYLLWFVTILAMFSDSYRDTGYGNILLAGIFYVLASIFRFYSCSYLIADVRMAQSTYFYGSLAMMFICIQVWIILVFVNSGGDVQDPVVEGASAFFSVLDPTFGFYLLIVYQQNMFGVLSQNETNDVLSPEVGQTYLYMIVISFVLYAGLFVLVTEGGFRYFLCLLPRSASSVVRQVQNRVADETHLDVESGQLFPIHGHTAASVPDAKAPVHGMDKDVLQERRFVDAIVRRGTVEARKSAIFVHELQKVYLARGNVPAKVAVNNISLSIAQGEIFGLLGANGAGKTTLLKMVSGLEEPSSGIAMINGYDVVTHTTQAQRSMGLCPQFDTLLDRLSVRENLLFFGRIKGLEDAELTETVEAFMQALNIKRYEHKLTQHLSGGNRRKVSLAVALIGAPPTVYLDEPSTGLDPVASRLMWRLLSKIADAKSTAIVLTTHNMLECEAVCTRLCIMKMGEIVCLGNTQHLRSTHGTGFQLEFVLKDASFGDRVKAFVDQYFAESVLLEEHGCMLNFEVPRRSIPKMSQAFRLLEQHREALGCEDYSLSQSTLEQVFLKKIRPKEQDVRSDPSALMHRQVPLFRDYATGYLMWFLSLLFPGLHHYYLGDFWRGVKYTLTYNEVNAGWVLDLFEMHVLVQKSVQEHGHIRRVFCCNCCLDYCCCHACRKKENLPLLASNDEAM